MGKKRTPQTPREYAAYLYALESNGNDALWNQHAKIRVAAFIDGVAWERRRQKKLAREADQRVAKRVFATHSG